jgi:signal transduction histidine kinase/CheY-like chemotaxis protein/HPt (histidine-containing phosphotransfer) domain-containing protein
MMRTPKLTAPPIVHLVLVAMAYFVSAGWALKTFGTASPLWFANAIGVAALLRHSPSTWPAFLVVLAMCDALATRWFGDGGPPWIIAASDALEIALTAALINKLGGITASFSSVAAAARIMAACLAVPLLSATAGAFALSESHQLPFHSVWRSWYVANSLGLLVATPMLLMWSDANIRKDMLSSLSPARAVGLLAGLTWLAMLLSQNFSTPMLFLSFPLVLVMTWVFGLLGGTSAVMTATVAAVAATLVGNGPVAALIPAPTTLELRIEAVQLYLFTMLFCSLPFAVLLIQQRDLAAKLRKASDARSDFLATMSHEIRTPMTAVLGMVDLLRAEKLTPVQAGYVDVMRSSGRHLLSVINDILDFSRMESGKLELEQMDFSLPDLLERLRSLAHPLAVEKGLDLHVEIAPHSPLTLRGDPTRLKQVLLNLVSNGIKFTQRGGVTVTVSQLHGVGSDARFRFEVRDTGLGIPSEKLGTLFAPFTQVDNSTARRFGGSGLGLAISKRLVNAMGGEIGVRSSPDLGSLFYFEVPLGRGDPLNLVRPSTAATGPVTPRRILIAEDVEINRVILRSVLSKQGHTLVFADHGGQAVELVEKQAFDLVLMDVQMPVMDGVEATRRIRRLAGATRDIPILGLTANVMARERERYLEAGMNDCLMKPIDWDQLEAAMKRHTGGKAPSGRLAATTGRALLDGKALGTLRRSCSPADFEDIIHRSLAAFDRYQRAIAEGSPEEAAREAHKVKGAAGTLGFMAIMTDAAEIESAVADARAYGHLILRLDAAIEATRSELVATAIIAESAPTR